MRHTCMLPVHCNPCRFPTPYSQPTPATPTLRPSHTTCTDLSGVTHVYYAFAWINEGPDFGLRDEFDNLG